MFRIDFLFHALALFVALLTGQAQAATIDYVTSHLAGNRWSYDYQLSGSFGDFEVVNLIFAPPSPHPSPTTGYADLDLTAPPDPALWASLVTQPVPSLAADGLLGLTALGAQSPIKLPFTLEFTWFGGGSPGAQDFEILDDSFNVIGVGRTRLAGAQAIPEPGSLLLLTAALALLHRLKRRS